MDDFLLQALIYLAAGVVAAPIARRLGLGSVLGFLAAGIVIGPALGLVGDDAEDLQHVAEFGVVMMLFVIGLELEPRKLWEMRARVLGLGGLQVALTAAAVAAALAAFGLDWRAAAALGLILALSSTAIVLQTLGEKGWLATDGGKASFAVLLLQDIAVIPILAALPLLAAFGAAGAIDPAAAGHAGEEAHAAGASLIAHLPGWGQALAIVAAIAAVVVAGRYLTRPALRFIARSGLAEIFTPAVLLLVIAIAFAMTLVGVSPALGAFVAGMVLADSEYRHEIEADIQPFKSLFLGLFFITVGAGIRFDLLAADLGLMLAAVAGLMLLKFALLYGLAAAFRLAQRDRLMVAMGLAQAGEFAFVLLAFAQGEGVLGAELAQRTALVVAISMLLTPVAFLVFAQLIAPGLAARPANREADVIDETGVAIVAGVGRFGQIVNRLLTSQGFATVVIDHAADQVETLAMFEQKAYFGDATRPELLRTAGIAGAKLFVCAIDDRERAVRAVAWVKLNHPQVRVVARAFDRVHYYELRRAGADVVVRELFGSSVLAGEKALQLLGVGEAEARRVVDVFVRHDEETVAALYEVWNGESDVSRNPGYVEQARLRIRMLRDAMALDEEAFDDDDAAPGPATGDAQPALRDGAAPATMG
jgi:monovalent cation:proton antiporter-2 (CPA2) family protein